MKLQPLPLALPMAPHQSAPRDRAIWITANIICRDEISSWVEPYEGYAEWSESSQDWLDSSRMSIRQDYHAELRILRWEERAARAARHTEDETSVGGSVYFWDDEWRRETGTAGYFAVAHVNHSPTLVQLAYESAGPFGTRAQALGELIMLLTKITSLSLRAAA